MKYNTIWSKEEIKGIVKYNNNLQEIEEKNTWHNLFLSPKWILHNPAEEIVKFYLDYLENPSEQIKKRTKVNIKKIHDLGCGGGRHLYFFKELGYEVTGSDISENAVEYTLSELKRREMNARVVKCSMTNLPFQDNEFDVTISRAAINHANLNDMKKAIFEVARTTQSGGLFFLTVSSDRASDYNNGIEVENEVSYIPQKGPEKGLIHTFFTAGTLSMLLEPFFFIDKVFLSEHASLITEAKEATDPKEYFGSEYIAIAVRR